MKKRKYRKRREVKNISNIFKGKFLVEDNAVSNWKFIIFCLILAFISITSAHLIDLKVVRIAQLKEESERYKASYAIKHIELMKLKVESELESVVAKDSLFPIEEHPYRVIVKKDKNKKNRKLWKSENRF